MVSPVVNAFEHFVAPITKALGRAFTPPGMGGGGTTVNVAAPTPPPALIPAQQPARARPTGGGMQQSFLAGAAQAQLPGQAGASTAGKTLLGS